MDSNSSSGSFLKLNNTAINYSQMHSRASKEELKRYLKLKLILGIIKNFAEEGGDLNSSDIVHNQNAVKLTKIFIANNYLQNIGLSDYIQVGQEIQLSHSEQQLVNGYLISQLKTLLTDSIKVIRSIKVNNPQFLDPTIIPESAVIDLEINRQQLYKELVLKQQKKYMLLSNLIEVRLSPQIEQHLHILLKEFQILDQRVKMVSSVLNNFTMTQTPYTVNAMKKIEAVVDKKLEEKLKM